MSDVLKDVVKSPWFEWREGMVYVDRYGNARVLEPGWVVQPDQAPPLADHDANVGPLLSMLRAALPTCDRMILDWLGPDHGWLVSAWNQGGDLLLLDDHDAQPTPTLACCAALLALPEKP